MRRLSGVLLTAALILIPAFFQGHASGLAAQGQKLTFDGDIALWSVGIKADKTADFESLMGKVKEALQKSEKPERKQQAAGWKVVKQAKPLPDGTVLYTHVINPVVKDADYTILTLLYEANADPAAQKALYEQYRGAFDKTLALAPYATVLDMSK